MPWVEKYRPKKLDDVKGQDYAVQKLKDFIKDFGKRKKLLILHGPPGTGKTTLAHVIANEKNSEIFELNASDLRNKQKLQETLKPAIEQKSLLKENKIILVDEVDGISGVDRGGIQELLKILENTTYPVIITANDIWKKSLSTLRSKGDLVQLKEISYKIIQEILQEITKKEQILLNPNIIKSIAIRSKGDIRAAINDLQTTSRMRDPSLLSIDERDKEIDIFTALRHIFKGKPTKDTLRIFDSVNMSMDEIILWMEENIPKEYGSDPVALEKAYNRLSKVDVFRGRIYKQQYWRFLLYENILAGYGISSAKSPDKPIKTDFTSYKKPSRILKIWINNQRIEKKKKISEKYAKLVHVGKKRALSEFPIIKQIILSHPIIQKELKLTEDEIAYLQK